jgi:hypothetical protein
VAVNPKNYKKNKKDNNTPNIPLPLGFPGSDALPGE